MPPLNTPRTRRRIGEIVVAAGLAGALWGSVGSAEAGVSAGSAASASFAPSASHATTLGARVGTGPAARRINVIQPPQAEPFACTYVWYATSLNVTLGNGFTSLAARVGPCTSTSPNGTWTGGTIGVTAWTDDGTKICRGSTYQQASTRWYKTSKGWIWSGGTSRPSWNATC